MKPLLKILPLLLALISAGCDRLSRSTYYTESETGGRIAPIKLTDANFQREVLENDLPVLVDMWAPWCKPCTEMKPTIRQLALELIGQVKVTELNIEENRFVSEKYNVVRYPTLVIFVDGIEVERIIGIKTVEELVQIIRHFRLCYFVHSESRSRCRRI